MIDSGSTGFSREWGPVAQPGVFKKSVKSVDFLLQQVQPLTIENDNDVKGQK